jgi:tRNA(fMet)-specific endonuclease VapC
VRQLIADGGLPLTTRLNEAEFRLGQFRAADPAREAQRIEQVLAMVGILEFDAAAARRFAQLQAALLDIGRPAGEIDALVASIALENGQPLATRNPAHFQHIDGLTVLPY